MAALASISCTPALTRPCCSTAANRWAALTWASSSLATRTSSSSDLLVMPRNLARSAVVQHVAGDARRRGSLVQTLISADGSAEPRGQLAEQLLLVFTGPRHVAVRPQQH